MEEKLNKPTVGRFVHYYPSEHEGTYRIGAANNGSTFVPALVTQVFSWHEGYTGINLTVFPDGGDTLWAPSTQHESTRTEGAGYWVWPPVK